MSNDQQGNGHRSLKPQLQVRIQAEQTNLITIHPATFDPLNNTPAGAHSEKKVQSNTPKDGNNTIEKLISKLTPSRRFKILPPVLRWIPANWSWSKWKPVLRSALAAWISLLLFLIPTTMDVMGQAAFLIIIASFLSPSSEPFIVLLKRELGILTFAVSGWAWSCLGIKLADMARSNKDLAASSADIIAGKYIEPAPTVIMAVFLFFGSFFFLYIKTRIAPGTLPFTYLFSCMLCMDTSLTVAAFYPFPYYAIGKIIVLPLVFHSAVALVLSLCLFPTSVSATFTMRLQDVLLSLVSATKEHCQCLQNDVTAYDFSPAPITAAVSKAEGVLAALSSAARLQKFDIIYSRFAPTDYKHLHSLARSLVVKASGMSVYYSLIDPTRERFPTTPAPSIPVTPAFTSPSPSRPPSPVQDQSPSNTEKANDHGSFEGSIKRQQYHRRHSAPLLLLHNGGTHHRKRRHLALRQTHTHHSTHSHSSLLHIALSRAKRTESAVGVFECLNYLNLEATHMYHPDLDAHVTRSNELLSSSCQDLLKSCEHGLQATCDWLSSIRANFFNFCLNGEEKKRVRMERIKRFETIHRELSLNLDEFTNKKRLTVLDPYRAMFIYTDDTSPERETPSHRHLFHCYVYQYHLMRFATSIRDVLSEIIRLETERKAPRVWFPTVHWSKLAHWTAWEATDMVERDDDEDPDIIPGFDPSLLTDLGQAVRRDPDALPPRNALEKTVNWMYHMAKEMAGGNFLFALKAGILTIILSLPSFLHPSAEFAYRNKFVWAVVMAQLTGARFRGDTTFGFVTRLISTFVGGVIGTLMWYVSTGSGKGSAVGLAAVCFVCFPFFFFFRLYWPVAPMTNLIIWVTTAVIFGYSYQDTHLPSPSSPGYGVTVAWKRFILVIVGVLAASIFSYLPPSTTIRLYQRRTLATATQEIGSVYCSVISFASTKREGETTIIVQHLLAILNKLKRSIVLKENAVYEFSLRGQWPAERYQRILELQIQILNLLCQLTSVLEQMEPAWTHAFLRRTRLSDADFQGDVLAVMTLISFSLRTGKPLPQVTPCPLLNRFMEHQHGLNVVREESEEDFGLPKMLTEETLESLQYLIFCVGVSTTFSIVMRLDKLMVAVKELVGEQYHIDGVGLPLYNNHRRGHGVEMRTPVATLP